MSIRLLRGALAACLALSFSVGGVAPVAAAPKARARAVVEKQVPLRAFKSDAELKAFLARRDRAADRWLQENPPPPPPPPAPPPPPPPPGAPGTASATASSITNNQEANVDEGDIVKNRGDTLIILRRGRLFTVSTAGGGLRAVDAINAYPPGVDGRGDWYDEMLVAGDTVVVIGYSYSRGGTQINRFKLGADGKLSFHDAYQLKSADYYSSRNYASRLIGDTLIVYSPMSLSYEKHPLEVLPAVRKWSGQKGREGFKRIIGARQIYLADNGRGDLAREYDALHAVSRCKVTGPELDCTSTGVIGDWSRTFYVSSTGVYVWTSFWVDDDKGTTKATLYRLPLDGGKPSAVRGHGQPVDQFSFREAADHRSVDVVVRPWGDGDAMWNPEFTGGAVALYNLPVDPRGQLSARGSTYRILPKPVGSSWSFQNRFVGPYLLYGADYRDEKGAGNLTVVPLDGAAPSQLTLAHGVERIDLMGQDAIVVGGGGDALRFSSIELTDGAPRVGDTYALKAASQGETRSHGFFYRPDPTSGAGVFGLPVDRWVSRPDGSGTIQGAVLFVRRDARRFRPLGELAGGPLYNEEDGCVASCVDWYGNARPIFLGQRVYALMGYELVEGVVERDGVREVRRMNFQPTGRPKA